MIHAWRQLKFAEIEEWRMEVAQLRGHNRKITAKFNSNDYMPLLLEARKHASEGAKFDQVRGVYIPPGVAVDAHTDGYEAFIYMLHDHPSRLCVEEQSIGTVEGTMVKVPLGCLHSVSLNEGDPRLTLAVMFKI